MVVSCDSVDVFSSSTLLFTPSTFLQAVKSQLVHLFSGAGCITKLKRVVVGGSGFYVN